MKRLHFLLLVGLCGTSIFSSIAAASTVAVGSCRRNLTSYETIPEAVAAAPSGSTILICPGTYTEPINITDSLNLLGASPIAIAPAVVTAEISISGIDEPGLIINFENIVVDGTRGNSAGISYEWASGTISEVLMRGAGIGLDGSPFLANTVNLENSYIYNGDISAGSNGGTGCLLNINHSVIESTSGANVSYDLAQGVIANNFISVKGGTALELGNFFSPMIVEGNVIEGASVAIAVGGNEDSSDNVIRGNTLVANATAISLEPTAGAVITANTIIESTAQAIDLQCSIDTTVKGNYIDSAPIAIANVEPGDMISPNRFHSVGTYVTNCQ